MNTALRANELENGFANTQAEQRSWAPYSRLILVVDSSTYSGQATQRLFKSLGYSVELCHSPSGALDMLRLGRIYPDLIFVEMKYHTENFIRFPRDVHSHSLWKSIPIVAHSAPTEKQNIVRAIQNGYADYIIRPTESDILKEKLDKVLKQSTEVDGATFALPVSANALAMVDLELTAISEFGIQGVSRTPLLSGTVLGLKSDLLSKFDLEESQFRVTGCEKQESLSGIHYKVGLTFVALSPKSARLIRQFLIRNAARELKVSS